MATVLFFPTIPAKTRQAAQFVFPGLVDDFFFLTLKITKCEQLWCRSVERIRSRLLIILRPTGIMNYS